MNDRVAATSLRSVENDRSGQDMQPTSARCANFTTPQGVSTSRLPLDSGTALYKGLDAAPLEANFAFPDPPPVVANMIGQQLAAASDLIRQAQKMTQVYWGSPSEHTPSIAPTMLITDLIRVRGQDASSARDARQLVLVGGACQKNGDTGTKVRPPKWYLGVSH